MSENIGKKFEDYMRGQKVDPEVLGDRFGVFIAEYADKTDKDIALMEFGTEKEFNEWYERMGRGVEKSQNRKIAMRFGSPEKDPIVRRVERVLGAKSVSEKIEEEKGRSAAKNLIDEVLKKKEK